jgi:hypothetical protein
MEVVEMIGKNGELLLAKAIELVAAHPTRRTADATAIYTALGWDWDQQQPNPYRIVEALAAEELIIYTPTMNNITIQPTEKGVTWILAG